MSAHKIILPLEFEFANDAFVLVPECTQDGAREQAELDATRAAQAAQDKTQLKLNVDPKPPKQP